MHLTQLILYKTPWKLNRKENNCHSFNTQYKEKDNTHSLNEWMKGWDRATQGNLTSPNTYIQRRSRGFAGVTECWYLSFLCFIAQSTLAISDALTVLLFIRGYLFLCFDVWCVTECIDISEMHTWETI